ncbi:hypothetical protein OB69_00350 [Roseivirga seohaensis subsp. aquiponti]|uniref:Uncharacterized protein n=1 Tax=Roseivirga seohaensis subsp. aquiponti TaxID=1566026 RepID=A0A0L8AQQ1_9BACT|nr:hypothetical protein OB69_00350 [Roseivirga seohaensis subsp. aquiponti]
MVLITYFTIQHQNARLKIIQRLKRQCIINHYLIRTGRRLSLSISDQAYFMVNPNIKPFSKMIGEVLNKYICFRL